MKKIYILLMHTNTVPSRLVKIFTKYKYSHVALSFNKECDEIYSFGRKNLKTPLKGGFVKENKTGEFFNHFKNTICKIYEIEVSDEQFNNAKKIINEMEQNADIYKYDFIGVVLRFFKIPVTFKNRYVCSYFVADILEKTKICKFDKKLFFIEPKDFEKLENLKQIYSGKYNLYC